jgi:hypothetical protein
MEPELMGESGEYIAASLKATNIPQFIPNWQGYFPYCFKSSSLEFADWLVQTTEDPAFTDCPRGEPMRTGFFERPRAWVVKIGLIEGLQTV